MRDYLSTLMTRMLLIAASTLISGGVLEVRGEQEAVSDSKYTVAAYYFPSYHPDPRREDRYGKVWTEWELVKNAKPRFENHKQPKVPLWGYEDESDPGVMAKRIGAAAEYGIDAFIFDWYWYDGPFLQAGLERGFLKAENNDRLKFGLMWANHDWTEIFPRTLEHDPLVLYPGAVTPATFEIVTEYLIENYFRHPSYWKIDGCPYFSFYDLSKLIESFGSLQETREALDRFRTKTEAAGFPGLHINIVMWGQTTLPNAEVVSNPAKLVEELGFDSVTSYVWVHHVRLTEFPQTPYRKVMDEYMKYAHKAANLYSVPYYPNVTVGWDSSPRTDQSGPFINAGYPYTPVMVGNTPDAFREGLFNIQDFLDAQPADRRILTLNCWNEWTEGSYLEPDTESGLKYLEAVRSVFKEGAYRDGRPTAKLRLEAKDQGVVLRHGDGPNECDVYGARDVWVFESDGTYYMHYDAAGHTGWLCSLAVSKDLVHWEKKGPILDLGEPREEDSKSASYGVTYFEDGVWHLFYLGTPNTSPAPDRVPTFPYVTMKARSASPTGPWTKQKDVVPFRMRPGTYYETTASPGHVIEHNDEYLQFFSASAYSNGFKRTLGIARAKDLTGVWTVDPEPIVPLEEQVENSSLYYEETNDTWFLFTNHVGIREEEYTDAVWVYWSKDLNKWDSKNKAVVLDPSNCGWSKGAIGLPSALKVGDKLALFYDGVEGNSTSHMGRDVGLAWLELPLVPPKN